MPPRTGRPPRAAPHARTRPPRPLCPKSSHVPFRFHRAPLALLKSLVPALALAATLAPAAASAQEAYPQRPITLVVPHPPGGSVDGVARIYAEQLAKELGQSVVVENRAGASGMIGAAYVSARHPMATRCT